MPLFKSISINVRTIPKKRIYHLLTPNVLVLVMNNIIKAFLYLICYD